MSFRTLALSGVAALALGIATPRPAQAQMLVFDSATLTQLVASVQQGLQELAYLQNQLQVAEQSYNTVTQTLSQIQNINNISQNQLTHLTNFYQSFAHVTLVTQLVPILQAQSSITPLAALATIENDLRGAGFSGSLASSSLLAVNQIYKPTGTDFAATHMNQSAAATSGQMAAAQGLYTSAQTRASGMQQLMSQLAMSADPKQTADLAARASIENGITMTQVQQALALHSLQTGQNTVQQQQMDQAWRQDVDNLQASAATAATTSTFSGSGTSLSQW